MKALEEKFGSPHPALEGFKEPSPQFNWLVDSFFRLHRRRQHSQNGYQPIKFADISDFSRNVLRLPPQLDRLFLLAMEETDNAVLFDHYTKASKDAETAAANRPKKPRKQTRR